MNTKIVILTSIIVVSTSLSVHANPIKEKFEAATKAFSEGRYPAAIQLYEETVDMYPKLAPAYFFMGMSHQAIGTPATEVVWLFEKTIELDPNHAQAHEHLGKMFYGMGRFEDAEKYSLKALELEPENLSAQLTLAWTYLLGQSRPEDAIEYFEGAIEATDTAYAYLGMGMAYFMIDERAKVLDIITKLRQKDENGLAEQLEVMVRQGRSTAPKAFGAPVFSTNRKPSSLVRDDAARAQPVINGNPSVEKMPVRLSGSLPGSDDKVKNPPASGKERIQALRRRSQKYSKGSGY